MERPPNRRTDQVPDHLHPEQDVSARRVDAEGGQQKLQRGKLCSNDVGQPFKVTLGGAVDLVPNALMLVTHNSSLSHAIS